MTERMTDFFPLLQRLGTRSRLSCYLYTMRITKWLKASEPVSCFATLISLCFSVGDIQPRGRRGECLSRDLSGWQYARATWFALVFTKRATFRDPDSTLPEDAGFTVDHVMSCSHLCTTFCTLHRSPPRWSCQLHRWNLPQSRTKLQIPYLAADLLIPVYEVYEVWDI